VEVEGGEERLLALLRGCAGVGRKKGCLSSAPTE
jgi:hypothetical protein